VKKHVFVYGLLGGMLILLLKVIEYRYLLSSSNEARQRQLTGLAQCSDVYFSISSAAVIVDLSFLSGP